jgi:pyrimidine oxygenase
VTHHGRFYDLEDCMSEPKPSAVPHVICAGTSDRGFRFTIEHTDGALISGQKREEVVRVGRRAKELAAELGRTTKTYGLFTLVPGETDAQARNRVEHFDSGVDTVALQTQAGEYAADVRENTTARRMIEWAKNAKAVGTGAFVGSPETIAAELAEVVVAGDLGGVVVIVPDFLADLRTVGEQVVPLLAEHGVRAGSARTLEVVAP